MNISRADLAAELTKLLGLATLPIGIAFWQPTETPGIAPVGFAHPAPTEYGRTGAVSAPCVFWTLGAERVFSRIEADHGNWQCQTNLA